MDNSAPNFNTIIAQQVQHEVEHALGHAVNSPALLNRVIGESMRHIGSFLDFNSASYLPIQKEEVLCQPQPFLAGKHDAVLLVARAIRSQNAFLILAESKTIEDKRDFKLFAYQPDPFSLIQTKFVQLSPELGAEIIRQLSQITNGDGAMLIQAVVVENFFPAEPAGEKDGLFNSDTAAAPAPAAEAPAAAPTAQAAGLPAVSEEPLL